MIIDIHDVVTRHGGKTTSHVPTVQREPNFETAIQIPGVSESTEVAVFKHSPNVVNVWIRPRESGFRTGMKMLDPAKQDSFASPHSHAICQQLR